MNKAILIGRLGKDPELKSTPSGTAVANFSMATTERYTDKQGEKQEQTEWHRITVWGKLAEICNEYLSRGSQVALEGRIQTRDWEDKDGNKRYTTEIIANNVEFLGSNKTQEHPSGATTKAFEADEDSNIPF